MTGEELRKLFVELGRKGDLLKPQLAAKGVIDMLVLVDLPREFFKIDGSKDEQVLGIRVANGLDAKYKTIYYQTKRGFNLTLTFFMSDDKAMTIQAHRTLTNGDNMSYGMFLTLDDIIKLFHDYDKELKDYIYHKCWRARSIKLIKQMVKYMELDKSIDGIGQNNLKDKKKEIDLTKMPIRLLTVVNGKEKDEYDVPSTYLPGDGIKTETSPKLSPSKRKKKDNTMKLKSDDYEKNENKTRNNSNIFRLVIAKKDVRFVNAAKGFIAFRVQSWWRGLIGRRRVMRIRTIIAANIVVRYVRPWYIERQGRINHIQRVVKGHMSRINLYINMLTPLEEKPNKYIRIGLTYRIYRVALLRFFAAKKALSIVNSRHFSRGRENGRIGGGGGIRIQFGRR